MIIFIGTNLPGEYSGSIYTKKLKGAAAKAKVNAAQGIPEMIEIATMGCLSKIGRKNMDVMQKTDGTDMIQDLGCLFTVMMGKSVDTTYSTQDF